MNNQLISSEHAETVMASELFQPGQQVKTNKEYQMRNGRVVQGTVFQVFDEISSVLILCERQIGNPRAIIQGREILIAVNSLESMYLN